MNSGIYQISNTENNKKYIGSSVNIDRRWRDHLSRLKKGTHGNIHLQRAFNKYGEENFEFIILEVQTPEGLIPLEQKYLDSFLPEYNILPTAGSCLGMKFSEEHKKKISKSHKGKHHSEEAKRKMSIAHKGKLCPHKGHSHSEETRKKMSDTRKGKPSGHLGKHHSEETRKKLSIAKRGNKNALGCHRSEDTKKKMSIALKKYWIIKKFI